LYFLAGLLHSISTSPSSLYPSFLKLSSASWLDPESPLVVGVVVAAVAAFRPQSVP
jgi:hypothetical protein